MASLNMLMLSVKLPLQDMKALILAPQVLLGSLELYREEWERGRKVGKGRMGERGEEGWERGREGREGGKGEGGVGSGVVPIE